MNDILGLRFASSESSVICSNIGTYIIEGSLEAKLPKIWRDVNGTARKKLGCGESQKGEDKRWRRSEMEKVRRERNSDVEKVRREKIRDGEDQR